MALPGVSTENGFASVNRLNIAAASLIGGLANAGVRTGLLGGSFGDNFVAAIPDIIGQAVGGVRNARREADEYNLINSVARRHEEVHNSRSGGGHADVSNTTPSRPPESINTISEQVEAELLQNQSLAGEFGERRGVSDAEFGSGPLEGQLIKAQDETGRKKSIFDRLIDGNIDQARTLQQGGEKFAGQVTETTGQFFESLNDFLEGGVAFAGGFDVDGSLAGFGVGVELKLAASFLRNSDGSVQVEAGLIGSVSFGVNFGAVKDKTISIQEKLGSIVFGAIADTGANAALELNAFTGTSTVPATLNNLQGEGFEGGISVSKKLLTNLLPKKLDDALNFIPSPHFTAQVSVADNGILGAQIGVGAGIGNVIFDRNRKTTIPGTSFDRTITAPPQIFFSKSFGGS